MICGFLCGFVEAFLLAVCRPPKVQVHQLSTAVFQSQVKHPVCSFQNLKLVQNLKLTIHVFFCLSPHKTSKP